jgi:hypothetical protein
LRKTKFAIYLTFDQSQLTYDIFVNDEYYVNINVYMDVSHRGECIDTLYDISYSMVW